MTFQVMLKPHHFLDIIKLYGSGLDFFLPDLKYGHNFYKVGNWVLKNPQIKIVLTRRADDVCKSCKFLKDAKCTDKIKNFISKEEWNQIIDERILKTLNLKEGEIFTALKLCKLAIKYLDSKMIFVIWYERPVEETKKRAKYLLNGLCLYINSGVCKR